MSRVWEGSRYSGTHLLVLLALADWANDEGVCWPKVETLCKKARVSRATCQRVLADLERDGALVRDFRQNHSTLYRLLPGPQIEAPAPEDPEGPHPETPGPRDEAPRGLTGEAHNRQRTTTEPSPTAAPDGDGETDDGQGTLVPLQQGSTSTKRRSRVDALWDAVMFVCDIDTGSIPRSARGGYNAAVRDLREVGAEPAEVIRRAAIFRATYPGARLTPTALARRWAECAEFVASEPAQRVRHEAEVHSLHARLADLDAREGG
jgi:hypothetical protein